MRDPAESMTKEDLVLYWEQFTYEHPDPSWHNELDFAIFLRRKGEDLYQ